MNDTRDLTIQQLRIYKQHLIGEIKELQKRTREIDKEIKERLKNDNNKEENKRI